ncbi:2-hydroxyacyl-CoA dehydratase family protein [bacterium]|nr:2-hydroxyacyl-CoA dehydratase family protein [bacterium]
MVKPAVLPFAQALDDHPATLSEMVTSGRKALGYFCHYTPVELIHACGFIPVRISGGPGRLEKATNLVPDFICPYMKRGLERALEGDYRFLSGIVQGYSCDAACGVTNIWADNIQGELFHILPLPYEDSADSRHYLLAEFQHLINKLSDLGGNYTDLTLSHSLEIYNRIRNHILHFYQLRHQGKLPLTAKELWLVVQAGFVSPPETYLNLLDRLDAELDNLPPLSRNGAPILISGSVIESPDILEFLENRGGRIVADDLCSGMRSAATSTSMSGSPMENLMDRHFKRFPCPTRSRAEDRFPLIHQLIEQSGAKGVVFMFQKFCTPHLSDFPFLSGQLKAIHIPSVVIELDEMSQSDEQTGTRLEGLFEIIQD